MALNYFKSCQLSSGPKVEQPLWTQLPPFLCPERAEQAECPEARLPLAPSCSLP